MSKQAQAQGNLADIMAIGPDELGRGSSIRVETAGSRDDVTDDEFRQTHPGCTITMADYVAEAPCAVVA